MKLETLYYIVTASVASHHVRFVHSTPSNRFELPFRDQRQLQRQLQLHRQQPATVELNSNIKKITVKRNDGSISNQSRYAKNKSHYRLRGGSSDPTPPSTSSGSSYWQRRPPATTPTKQNSALFGYSSDTARPTFTTKNQPPQQNPHEQQRQQVEQQKQQDNAMKSKDAMNEFLSRDDRRSFIVRVYTILTGQLLVVSLSILGFSKNPGVQMWMMTRGRIVPMLSLLLSSIVFVIMSLSEEARQTAPRKWQLLTIFTLGEAIAIGFIASMYSSKNVISAMLATAVGTISVTLYTLMNRNPKRDLSQWGATLSSVGTIFFVYALIHFLSLVGILPRNFLPYSETIFCFLGASLFSFYLAYHTRLIVSGKHTKYQLNHKDYVFGAMLLYNDIVNIFLYILRILGDRDD